MVHYQPNAGTSPCGATHDHYAGGGGLNNRPKTTTDVAKVTCPSCLRYIRDVVGVGGLAVDAVPREQEEQKQAGELAREMTEKRRLTDFARRVWRAAHVMSESAFVGVWAGHVLPAGGAAPDAGEPTFACGRCGCTGEFYEPWHICGDCFRKLAEDYGYLLPQRIKKTVSTEPKP